MSQIEVERIYETVLFGRDLDAIAEFYVDVLGLRLVDGPDELGAAFRVPDGGVLLVFDPARSSAPARAVPSHGATGAGHIAFAVRRGELERWRKRFEDLEVDVEREVTWGQRGRSLYVRDPAGNSVELTEGELWPG